VKLFYAALSQRMHHMATSVLGSDALLLEGDPDAVDGGRWAHWLLWSRAMSIMGGSSEIQRNIVGERLLGLPREPRA
jgi:alkylation response protein AidB-like acyl-CoA dehydrogenase